MSSGGVAPERKLKLVCTESSTYRLVRAVAARRIPGSSRGGPREGRDEGSMGIGSGIGGAGSIEPAVGVCCPGFSIDRDERGAAVGPTQHAIHGALVRGFRWRPTPRRPLEPEEGAQGANALPVQ